MKKLLLVFLLLLPVAMFAQLSSRIETSLGKADIKVTVEVKDNVVIINDLEEYTGNQIFAHLATIINIVETHTDLEITYISGLKKIQFVLDKEWLKSFETNDIRKQSKMLQDLVKNSNLKSKS